MTKLCFEDKNSLKSLPRNVLFQILSDSLSSRLLCKLLHGDTVR